MIKIDTKNSRVSVVLVYSHTILIYDKGDCHGFVPGSLDT